MPTLTLRITDAELTELDATARALGLNRTDVVRARLRWALAMERMAAIKTVDDRRRPVVKGDGIR